MSDSINSNCYSKNVVVYKCVNLIANTASHVPWIMNHSNIFVYSTGQTILDLYDSIHYAVHIDINKPKIIDSALTARAVGGAR